MSISTWVWREVFSVVVVFRFFHFFRFSFLFFFGPNGRQIRIQRIKISLHTKIRAERTLVTPFSVTSSPPAQPFCLCALNYHHITLKIKVKVKSRFKI